MSGIQNTSTKQSKSLKNASIKLEYNHERKKKIKRK